MQMVLFIWDSSKKIKSMELEIAFGEAVRNMKVNIKMIWKMEMDCFSLQLKANTVATKDNLKKAREKEKVIWDTKISEHMKVNS